jgi:S-disulfanyl-L-cysteine oxidoreductase SoxD
MSLRNLRGLKNRRAMSSMMAAITVATACVVSMTHGAGLSAQGKTTTVADGVFNADQAKRGQTKYSQVCSTCHQADLSGSDQAPALVGGDFVDRWDGQSVADLADRIRTSMPADDVGSLTTPLSVDIVAYILQANKFPAGSEEMKPDRTALKTVMIKKK